MRPLFQLCVNLFGLIILIINQPSLMAEPIRGRNINPANIPFVASITLKSPGNVNRRDTFCSGSLIADNLVLTAAHCLEAHAFVQMDVVFGAVDLKDANPKFDGILWLTFGQWVKINDPHAELIGLDVNDLAIIKLDRRVTGVTPANISTMGVSELYGKDANLIGWGAGEDGTPRFLKKAKVQILTSAECEDRIELLFNSIEPMNEGIICTAADPFARMTSVGDSGAPLLDDNNNILGVNFVFCPEDVECIEDFVDEHRVNGHTVFIDQYKQFVDDMKHTWS